MMTQEQYDLNFQFAQNVGLIVAFMRTSKTLKQKAEDDKKTGGISYGER